MYRSRLPRIAAELRPTVRAALKNGADSIAQAAKDRVAVRSGALRDAIHVEDDATGFAVIAGDENVFYGHLVEHGGAHTAPRPFLVPALEERRAEVVTTAAVALRRLE